MRRKRHSPAEIASKLLQSDKMAADGMLQSEIARALNVSVMTYHRWRKAREQSGTLDPDRAMGANGKGDRFQGISELHSELHVENSRLRRLVTDLLLEVDRLEEKITLLPRADVVAPVPDRKVRAQFRRAARRRSESAVVSGKVR